MTKILLSKQKIHKLKNQLTKLEANLKGQKDEQGQRGGLLDSWHETAAHAATQAAAEAKVKELRSILEKAEVLPDKVKSTKVILGSRVEIEDEYGNISKYRLVHPLEAAPEKGLLSVESPLGKLLLGKKKGGQIIFNEKRYVIRAVN